MMTPTEPNVSCVFCEINFGRALGKMYVQPIHVEIRHAYCDCGPHGDYARVRDYDHVNWAGGSSDDDDEFQNDRRAQTCNLVLKVYSEKYSERRMDSQEIERLGRALDRMYESVPEYVGTLLYYDRDRREARVAAVKCW